MNNFDWWEWFLVAMLIFSLVFVGMIIGGEVKRPLQKDNKPAPTATSNTTAQTGESVYARLNGVSSEETQYQPVVITKEVIKEVPVYITNTVERIVTQNVVVEKTIYTGNLTAFKSVLDIRVWLNQWNYKPNPDWKQTAPGIMTFDPQANDCDKYALQMIQAGIRDGYYFGLVVNTTLGGDLQGQALVMTLAGNQIIFIEPQDKSVYKALNGNIWVLDK